MVQAVRHEWALNDRLVLDVYREQGFGAALMAAAESFVQSKADLETTPQKLTANVGQPSVLLMFLNKGFVARSEEDQKKSLLISVIASVRITFLGKPPLQLCG